MPSFQHDTYPTPETRAAAFICPRCGGDLAVCITQTEIIHRPVNNRTGRIGRSALIPSKPHLSTVEVTCTKCDWEDRPVAARYGIEIKGEGDDARAIRIYDVTRPGWFKG